MEARFEAMPTGSAHPSCLSCRSRCSAEWGCLNDASIGLIDRAKISRNYSPGKIVYNQGDPCGGVFCIESGLVGIRRVDEQGNSTLLRLVHPGETIGYKSFLRKAPHDNAAEALMPSSICFVDRPTVRGLLQQSPDLGLSFLDHSLRDLAETEVRYMESVTWRVRTRLLHILLVLYERFGFETENGEHYVELPISRQDLAGLTGTAPETMSRTIQRIQTEGLATFEGRRVRLSDIDAILRDVPMPP